HRPSARSVDHAREQNTSGADPQAQRPGFAASSHRRTCRCDLAPVRPGAHMQAALAVLEDILNRHRPAAAALADWGKSHRFAGASDRAHIANLVYDALRRRRSLAAQMGSKSVRGIVLAAASRALGLSVPAIIASADGSPHAIGPLSTAEIEGLARDVSADAPAAVRGDFPDWLQAPLGGPVGGG